VPSFDQLNRYREQVPRQDITLERIRSVLFKFLDVKEIKQTETAEQKTTGDIDLNKMEKAGLPAFRFTTAEKEAWLKAGMPNINKFLAEYRAKQKSKK